MLAFTMQLSKNERTPTHNHHHRPTTRKTGDKTRYGGRTGPHARTHPANPAEQIPSGLKTRTTRPAKGLGARFLRTQQCARPLQPVPMMVFLDPPKTGSTHIRNQPKRPNSQCSTSEQTPPQDVRLQQGSWPPHPEKTRACVASAAP